MKRFAHGACYTLAGWIFEGCSFAWPIADAIERRFKCIGCTQHYVDYLTAQRQQLVHKEQKAQQTDRF